ncbi:hypothetical protein FSP39_020204 [Pinctada imbricata]|uniref:Bromo domain-containing protein n=1 Tax=Pinctada imbricata TaxID=66713 RepID=A0AA88YFZ2_PINIB|nr:hypothetical protein FSP39_020204 [Pinctada imbricata]
MSGQGRDDLLCPNYLHMRVNQHARKLGHLSAVYCVAFDRTGHYIFTGADDALIKIWRADSCRLMATLRGHNSEITDIAVNFENTLLASGSCDKTIRVWCLRTKAPIAVLNGHTGMITSVQFCPQVRGEHRVLISTGGDGCVCFWIWDVTNNSFSPKPVKFIERSRAGAQMLCSSFSPGGVFLATGSADHVIRVYFLHGTTPEKICELEAHTECVDSICYSNTSERFVSGSRDGTARIWRYHRQEWRAIVLNMSAKLGCEVKQEPDSSKNKDRVTMVMWSVDDTYVVTAVSDCSLKVWDSHSGKLVHVLKGHDDEVFVLEHSPREPRIALSAGHDGHVIIWDIVNGTKIKTFFNMIEGQGHGAVFDCKWCPDGLSFAATDSHGHLLMFGFGSNEKFRKIPDEVFFHTDYRPLMRDANNYVLDEQTQQPPHLMPPPFLVDIDGNPYPPRTQRLVPGREDFKDDQLIPQMQVNDQGSQEVVGDMDDDQQEAPDGPQAQQPAGHRPSIDNMIQQLQREQDQRLAALLGGPMSPPPPPQHAGSSPRLSRSNSVNNTHRGIRRSGETVGVRQSLGNISQRATQSDIAAWSNRVVVKELDTAVLSKNEDLRMAHTEEETKKYMVERKKKPLHNDPDSSDSNQHIKTRKKKTKHDREVEGDRNMENEQTARNRLVTRALYDTEYEDDDDGSGSDAWGSSGEDGESSEYSDWVDDAGTNLQPPARRSKRKVKKRKISSSEDENEDLDIEDIDDKTEPPSDSDPDVARPSTSRKQPVRKKPPPPKPKKPPRPSRNTRRKRKREKLVKKMGGITELPPEFLPPEWLTDVIPRKSPYVPQMGDEVMYFRQGHLAYLQAVERHKVYEIDLHKNQPWHRNTNLREEEHMKIVGIKYENRPPRLCCLKLNYIDPATGKTTRSGFTLKYHDMPDVIDFIVLKQIYDTAIRRKWKPGARFRSIIDDSWWLGSIVSQSPYGEEFPDSNFQCFFVHWDNGENERLSPWDMEPLDSSHLPNETGGGVAVTPEELKSVMYVPQPDEWQGLDRDSECERILRGFEAIMQHSVAEPFLTPVDLNVFPVYAIVIDYLIDLSTIKARLENRFYRRINALQFDVRIIESNASEFNEAGTPIVKSVKILTETLLRFIRETDCVDPMPILNELCHGQEFKWESNSSGSDTEDASFTRKRKRSDNEEGPSKRQRNTLTTNKNPDFWKQECQDLLITMVQCEDSEPFRYPVNPEQYPDYFDAIDHPMDLSTVQEHLEADSYATPIDLCKDVRLIFSNSKLYNTNKRSRIYTMTLRLSAMFEEQIRDIITEWKMAVKRNKRSTTVSQRQFANKYRSLPRREAATTASSNIRASSSQEADDFQSPPPARAVRSARPTRFTSFPNNAQNDDEEDEEMDDRDEEYQPSSFRGRSRNSRTQSYEADDDYQPAASSVSTQRSRPVRRPTKKVLESNHYDSDTDLESDHDEERKPSNVRKKTSKVGKNVNTKIKSKRKSKRPKKSRENHNLANGNSTNKPYTTRSATGSIRAKHFKKSGSFSESESTSSETESEEEQAPSRTIKKSSSEKSSSSSSASSSSSTESSSSSNSDTESHSDTERTFTSIRQQSPRKRVVKPTLKAGQTFSNGREKKNLKNPRRTSSFPSELLSSASSRRTRFQGKCNVRYREEDSDHEQLSDNDAENNQENENYDGTTEEESDDNENSTSRSHQVTRIPVKSTSSRGRVRKLTARAQASLLGE